MDAYDASFGGTIVALNLVVLFLSLLSELVTYVSLLTPSHEARSICGLF
jgi:hypothetical protein